ncbi:hypothetical protein DY000_02022837 [Brassica cretica]|uniref:Uncharacterized protein n=1 Tax=Brassica cretica TaxID=69181 RepID=A0ABQ7E9P3_BRACR|nr:hypothetical protein DY000_02022837 [Brassica cretica]
MFRKTDVVGVISLRYFQKSSDIFVVNANGVSIYVSSVSMIISVDSILILIFQGPAWRLEEMIPGYFFPNSLPLIYRFCHRSRGITCALKSIRVAHSQQAPLRQDPVPLILLSWVPLEPELILNPDLVLGSSSISTRVHSRRRVGNEVCESMDSSESYLDLTAKIEELRNATVGEAPPSPGGDRFSPVGPLSVIGVEEVVSWRRKFRLPDDVTTRIPRPCDRVSDFELGEVPVYEGFFESGFRDQVPSLVAEISKDLPWAEESSFLEDLDSYAESRLLLCLFLDSLPIVMSRSDYPSGRDTVEQLLELPLERHEVSFLVSDEALNRCSIRDVMSGSRGDEALAEYKKTLETMSTRKAAAKRTAPVEDEEVQFVGSSRRQATTFTATSFSKKKSKVSALKSSPPVSDNWSKVLANLNTKAFPLTAACLASDGDSSMAIRSLQGDRLQAASQLFHLGERMEDKTTAQAEVDALTAQLREEKDAVLAKEREIKALKLKVQNQEEALERVAMENASLQKQLDHKEEDICELRYAAEVFDDEKAMAVNGAKVVACWELMREWLHRHSWEPAAALEQYKTVKTTEAEVLGLSVPFFDDEPQVPKRGGSGPHGSRCHERRRTRGSWDPGVTWRVLTSLGPEEPEIKVLKGPHYATLAEATLGTCWGISFYRSEAGHYRFPVLHAAFGRKPPSDLEGVGVGENPSARLCYFPRLEKKNIM